jgi:hypothetical protein
VKRGAGILPAVEPCFQPGEITVRKRGTRIRRVNGLPFRIVLAELELCDPVPRFIDSFHVIFGAHRDPEPRADRSAGLRHGAGGNKRREQAVPEAGVPVPGKFAGGCGCAMTGISRPD